MKNILLIACFLCLFLVSCKEKEEAKPETNTSTVTFNFAFKSNNGANLSDRSYFVTAQNDTVTPDQYQFYFSNIKLIDTVNNYTFTAPNSYRLIEYLRTRNTSTDTIEIRNVPAGKTFHKLEYAYGVDSVANTRTDYIGKGDLNPSNGMNWDWETGWKFFLLEGKWRNGTKGDVVLHVGTNANYRKQQVALKGLGNLHTTKEKKSVIFIDVNTAKVLSSPNSFRLADGATIMFEPSLTKKLADNYQGILQLTNIED